MTAEQVDTQDKSMARLAEILAEKGVDVLGYEDAHCCCPSKLYWGGIDLTLEDIEKLVGDSGYRIARIQFCVYEYEKGKIDLPWTYRTLEFVSS